MDRIAEQLKKYEAELKTEKDPAAFDRAAEKIAQWKAWLTDAKVNAGRTRLPGTITLSNGRSRSALEELVRWRLWARTGGGLMAELGSHQLDAASIFISALAQGRQESPPADRARRRRPAHVRPDRDAEDHVYCMFEFPAPGYDPTFDVGYKDPVMNIPDPTQGVPGFADDPNKKIVVTYSSINGNGFGGYGEVVMGTEGHADSGDASRT